MCLNPESVSRPLDKPGCLCRLCSCRLCLCPLACGCGARVILRLAFADFATYFRPEDEFQKGILLTARFDSQLALALAKTAVDARPMVSCRAAKSKSGRAQSLKTQLEWVCPPRSQLLRKCMSRLLIFDKICSSFD